MSISDVEEVLDADRETDFLGRKSDGVNVDMVAQGLVFFYGAFKEPGIDRGGDDGHMQATCSEEPSKLAERDHVALSQERQEVDLERSEHGGDEWCLLLYAL